jgi:hypothetical protein
VERWVVTLAGPGGDVDVTVESRAAGAAARLTCRAQHPAHPRVWELVALEER